MNEPTTNAVILEQDQKEVFNNIETVNLGSITGIIAATLVIMEVLKRLFVRYKGLGKVPAWIYAVFIAEILAFLANRVIKTDGHYLLEGDTFNIMWRAFLGAAAAGGFYTWFRNPESIAQAQPWMLPTNPCTNPFESDPKVTPQEGEIVKPVSTESPKKKFPFFSLLLCLVLLVSLIGCQCPERVAVRETMDAMTKPIRETQLDWAEKLAANKPIPQVTQAQLDQIRALHQEYNKFVEDDRAIQPVK